MSFIPWQKAQEESVGIVALTHSETAREERLKPSGWGVERGRTGWEVDAVPGRFGAQCNRSTLSIVNHCHPSEATRLALHAANPLCPLFQPSVGQAGGEPHQKVLELGTETKWVEGGRMVEKRGGKKCC